MKQKNILLVAPPFTPVSKDSIAGIEQMVYTLGKSLYEQGYNVHTLAREDSEVYGELVTGGFKDLKICPGAELEHFHQAMAYETSILRDFLRYNNIDVIIDRCQGISLTVSHEEDGPPAICSLDMELKYFLNPKIFDKLKEKFRRRSDCFAAVSKHVALEYKKELHLKELESRMNVVYNGIITGNFEFSEKSEDYLLYIGRIRKGKAPHIAIKAALETGHKIIVAGGNVSGDSDGQYEDKEYFDSEIKPLLNSDVKFFGTVNLEQKVKLMQNAKGFIFPSQHKEALPLVILESMACGTPVIAFNHTGAKEEIINGETGYLVDSYEQMLEAIKKIPNIDRKVCNQHIKEKFNYKRMGEEYSELIERVVPSLRIFNYSITTNYPLPY